MGFNSGFKGLITCCIAYHTRGLKRLRVICHNLPCSILVHRPSWRILTTHKPCLSITTSWLFTFALLTYLFTPWSRVLLEKLTGSQLVIKFPAFYETRRFITAFTSASHLFLSWANNPGPRLYLSIFRNKICLHGEELLAPRPNPKLEDHPLSAVGDC